MNPASQLQLSILMAIAEFERSIIQERVAAGLRAAKAKGIKLGRPATLTEDAQSARSLVNQGLGVRVIARRLELPIASVFKLVKNAQ